MGVSSQAAKTAARPRVLVRRVAELPAATAEALDFLDYDFAGRRVWVKPNLLGPHRPDEGVTTEPELVRCVVRELKARGAAAVWVADNPGGALQRNVESYIAPTGVVEASEGCFRSIGETPLTIPIRSRFVKEIHVSRITGEADVILNLPVFKTHAFTIFTGSVKNLYGIVPGGEKSYLHTVVRSAEEFGELVVDIYQAVPIPVLTVMDGLRGMDGQNGPNGGRVLSIGRLLAGSNPVALDVVMAAMAGADPQRVPVIRVAAGRGLGPGRLEEIDVVGDFARIPGFRVPSLRLARGITGVAAVVAYPLMRRWPLLDRGRCTRCRRCADNCPGQAIAMTPFPAISRRECITCFCCVELCPARAMAVPGVLRGFFHNILGR